MTHVGRPRTDTTGAHRARPELQLVVLTGQHRGRRRLLDDRTTIGRAETTVMLSEEDVSRRHVEIRWFPDRGYVLRDLGSANGTTVNGQLVEQAVVNLDDEIQVGPVKMRLESYDSQIEVARHRQRLEALGSLGAGMAHDLNNTLCAAMGNVELLFTHDELRPIRDPELWEILRDIRGSLERTAELAPRFLDFSRASRSAPARIDVSNVCREVVGLLSRTVDRSIRISANLAPALEIIGSDTAVHQIVMNLCLNARDAMAERGGDLRVLARKLKPSQLQGVAVVDAGAHIMISVTDTGHGMDASTREQIYQPFFTTRQATGGSGLGLSTVMDLVREHGAHIEVESRLGEGTSFRVYFRAARAAPRTRRIGVAQPQGDATSLERSEPLRVLLVDDDEHVRRTLSRMLRQSGHEVVEAANGEEAVQAVGVTGSHYDVVLLDVDMPVKDGEQTQQQLRQLCPDLPIIVISGHVNDHRMRRMAAAGAAAVLNKPISAVKLQQVLMSLSQQSLSLPPERRMTAPALHAAPPLERNSERAK